jgi:hypothetical protein
MEDVNSLKERVKELETRLEELEGKKKEFFANKPVWIQVRGTRHQLEMMMRLLFKMEMYNWLKLKFMERIKSSRGVEAKFNYPFYQNFKIQLDDKILQLIRNNVANVLPTYDQLQKWREEHESR